VRLNKLSFQVSISALLIGLSAVVAAAQTESLRNLSNIRIDNFGRINDGYYRGAQPRGQDYADLAALGVKTVIDLTQDGDVSEPGLVRNAKMKFHRIPMTTHVPPTSAQIGEFLTIVNNQANWPVYVHCQGGRHRTGVMTAVYRMMKDGWKPDQAFQEMKQYKYGPDFLHPEFKSFVYDYYTQRDRWATASGP
jgi:protein tyrosine/serine phosphatase